MSAGQIEFTSALLDPEQQAPKGVVDSQGRPAGKRFDVYRNNVVFSLLEAMQTAFPVIEKLVGSTNFRTMCTTFVRQHPPTTPLLMFYGADFPAFLAEFEPLEQYPYMADMARLELARRVSYHAADATPIPPAALGEVAPEQLMEARFDFAPSMQIITSIHPIVDLWEFNMIEAAPSPAPVAQTALITRPDFDPNMIAISDGTNRFIQSMQNGETLAEAFETAAEQDTEFDLSTTLGLLLQTQIITKIDL